MISPVGCLIGVFNGNFYKHSGRTFSEGRYQRTYEKSYIKNYKILFVNITVLAEGKDSPRGGQSRALLKTH
jgi:hypothetical protein